MSFLGTNKPAILQTTGVNISNVSYSNGIITVNTSSAHSFIAGDDILIQNVSGMPDVNRLWTINNVINASTFNIIGTSAYTTGTGGIAFLGVWFKWCKTNYDLNLNDVIEQKSIITGKRDFKLLGEHANCEVDYYVYKLRNNDLEKRKFLVLYSMYGQKVYFLPYGVYALKTSNNAMDISFLKELKLLKLGGFINYDIIRVLVTTTSYHDITKLLL